MLSFAGRGLYSPGKFCFDADGKLWAKHGEMRPQAVDHAELAVRDELLLGLAVA
jgi:hypothetical protein